MSTIIKLPNIGDLSGVEVIEIAVKPGDKVAKEDPLITLESDKAAMDIPSPEAGTIVELMVAVGDKISEGDAIVSIEVKGTTEDKTTTRHPRASGDLPTSAPHQRDPRVREDDVVKPNKPAPDSQPHQRASHGMPHAGPAVRKLARKLGVDLSQVSGTGPHQRILKEDVQAFVKAKLSQSGHSNTLPPRPEIDFSQFGEIETQELSKINRLTGQNTHRAWLNIPHVTQFDEADITELEDFRQSIKQDYQDKGIKLSLLPFIVKAVVSALKGFPRFNSSLDASGDNLVLKKYIHIGIAVDTPRGLVVPVIKNADCKSISDIAQEIAELADKAKTKKLKTDEMQGGCLTISSLGHLSGTAFTPIINEPEVAILGVSPAAIKPVYDGRVFQARLMLPLSLSYDHRVIDGVLAARFTQYLGKALKDSR